jgi:AcrR family transcriptional regulator
MRSNKPVSKKPGGTRDQLLEAAIRVFSEKSFRDATVAEICELAGANIAAVNYHFGDKETLYVEAWRVAFQRSIEAYPPDGGIPKEAFAEDRLRGRIVALMRRIADPETREFEIIHREMSNPTGLLSVVMHESILPLQKEFHKLIRELLGEAASDEEIQLCQMSILGQCMHPMMHYRRHQHFAGKMPPPPPMPDIEVVADHIVRFSLAGLREVRKRQARRK